MFLTKQAASTSGQRDTKPRPMLDQALFGQGLRSFSGHRCRSNLWVRYRSASTASLANWAGVKNLRWHLLHDAITGTFAFIPQDDEATLNHDGDSGAQI
jgi:hypothetical protein